MNTFENLSGTPFGTLELTVVEMNGLGLNPNAILAGDSKGPLVTGTRIVVDMHGTLSGDIAGTFNGSDYANVVDGKVISNTHGMLVTEEGEKLSVKILGETLDGEMRAEIRLRHYGALSAVNDKTLLARGPATPGGKISLTIFEVSAKAPFVDPDVSTVDYANFPFTLEGLQSDPDAQSVYSGEGRLNGAESFGVDTMAVFGGQVPIPQEGLRMNGYFAGPAVGGINGVISGRNFLFVTPDGASHMNSKIIVRTFDGETLLVEAQGASFMQTGPAWWETSRTASNLPRYAEMTQRFNVGVGSTDVASGQIFYNHFSLPKNPFDRIRVR